MKSEFEASNPPLRSWPASWLWNCIAWFLERLYTDWAWGYDLIANLTSIGQWWHWQEAAIQALPAGRLLELGFGTGRLMNRMLSAGHSIYGVDRSRQMVQLTSRLLKARNHELTIIQGEAQALPLPSDSFSGVIATFPSDYFFQEQSLAEMRRILKSGGRVIVVPFAVITGRAVWDRAADLLYRITGQSPDEIPLTWLDQISVPGFELTYTVVKQERAKVLRVTLTKSV